MTERSGPSVGLIGCGAWGKHILRDLVALGCRVSVVTRSEANRAQATERGADEIVDSIGALPSIDGAVVAVPTTHHGEVIEQLAARDVPIFVEKPLTCDVASAARVAEMLPDRLFIMDKWRYHPGVEMLGRIARNEELGPVSGLRTFRLGWGNPHPDVDAVWILVPHDLSIGLEVLGDVLEPKSAVAQEVDGLGTLLVAVLGRNPWHALEISTRSAVRRREIQLHCRDGVAILENAYSKHVCILRTGNALDTQVPEPELRPVSNEMPLLRELRAFVDHLGGGPAPRSSADEGRRVVEAIATLRDFAGIGDGVVTP